LYHYSSLGENIFKGGIKVDNKINLLMFSSDYDKALAAFILANTARDINADVTMFFAFWGLLLVRQSEKEVADDKTFYEAMFKIMTPNNPEALPLSKMNMGGLGKEMLLKMMENKKAPQLTQLIKEARQNGVKFYGCKLSMEIMGFKKEELIPELEVIEAADYLRDAMNSKMQLFI